jgi:hypothetical protein
MIVISALVLRLVTYKDGSKREGIIIILLADMCSFVYLGQREYNDIIVII